jgi:transposase
LLPSFDSGEDATWARGPDEGFGIAICLGEEAHFTPTSASWLNPVEGYFAKLSSAACSDPSPNSKPQSIAVPQPSAVARMIRARQTWRPCWARIGIRPGVAAQLIREYNYLYGAVSPKDGTCVYLIMPTSNTECFQVFLEVLARKFARQDILLVLDGAPKHRYGDLAVPDNITLLYLPPYSPELNPKENLWDEIREKIFKNYALKSMHEVRASSNRQSSTSSAIPTWSAPSPRSPILSTHSDVETV